MHDLELGNPAGVRFFCAGFDRRYNMVFIPPWAIILQINNTPINSIPLFHLKIPGQIYN
jgi:hypothetical protein